MTRLLGPRGSGGAGAQDLDLDLLQMDLAHVGVEVERLGRVDDLVVERVDAVLADGRRSRPEGRPGGRGRGPRLPVLGGHGVVLLRHQLVARDQGETWTLPRQLEQLLGRRPGAVAGRARFRARQVVRERLGHHRHRADGDDQKQRRRDARLDEGDAPLGGDRTPIGPPRIGRLLPDDCRHQYHSHGLFSSGADPFRLDRIPLQQTGVAGRDRPELEAQVVAARVGEVHSTSIVEVDRSIGKERHPAAVAVEVGVSRSAASWAGLRS